MQLSYLREREKTQAVMQMITSYGGFQKQKQGRFKKKLSKGKSYVYSNATGLMGKRSDVNNSMV